MYSYSRSISRRHILGSLSGLALCLPMMQPGALAQGTPPGPTGIIGGVNNLDLTPSGVGIFGQPVRNAELQGTDAAARTVRYRIPLNGAGNFIFFYRPIPSITDWSANWSRSTEDSNTFLTTSNGSGYTVQLLDGLYNTVSSTGSVTVAQSAYTPNVLGLSNPGYFTQGTPILPVGSVVGLLKSPTSTSFITPLPPLGINGVVTSSNGQPVFGATVRVFKTSGELVSTVDTNGNGFYSVYYRVVPDPNRNFVNNPQPPVNCVFIEPGTYRVEVTAGNVTQAQTVSYNPSTSFNRNYYIVGANVAANFSVPVNLSQAKPIYYLCGLGFQPFFFDRPQQYVDELTGTRSEARGIFGFGPGDTTGADVLQIPATFSTVDGNSIFYYSDAADLNQPLPFYLQSAGIAAYVNLYNLPLNNVLVRLFVNPTGSNGVARSAVYRMRSKRPGYFSELSSRFMLARSGDAVKSLQERGYVIDKIIGYVD
jgi:hypothetical protein